MLFLLVLTASTVCACRRPVTSISIRLSGVIAVLLGLGSYVLIKQIQYSELRPIPYGVLEVWLWTFRILSECIVMIGLYAFWRCAFEFAEFFWEKRPRAFVTDDSSKSPED